MVHIHRRFYAAIKKNKVRKFVGKWIEIENIVLGEISLIQNNKLYVSALVHASWLQIFRGAYITYSKHGNQERKRGLWKRGYRGALEKVEGCRVSKRRNGENVRPVN